jgi:hypothetical protein
MVRFRFPAVLVLVFVAASAAFAQERGDPLGAIAREAVFDRAQGVNIGKTKSGKRVCYYREQGSSHTLDIGMTKDGAFMWLETGDSREMTPRAPLRVFAGKQLLRAGKVTDEFTVLQAYAGKADYFIPNRERGNFVLVAKGDGKPFLEMVARAHTEFVVVQSAADPKRVDYVAVYKFNARAIPALLACAKSRL